MNPALRFFLALILTWGSGFFSFALIGALKSHEMSPSNKYIYAAMTFVALVSGVALMAEAMGF